ncbi:unnamed protein product, partial [Vitis vinifera]|uniref:Uncharacterized protein n=1 Tax=Vitis vinifera TaxID=29760 RepID=D7TG33_VITVI
MLTIDYFLQGHQKRVVLNKNVLEGPSLYHYVIFFYYCEKTRRKGHLFKVRKLDARVIYSLQQRFLRWPLCYTWPSFENLVEILWNFTRN